MKRTIYTCLGALALILSVSCKENEAKEKVEIDTPQEIKQQKASTPDIADQAFVDGMTGKVWHNYLQIRTALVQDDTSTVQSISGEMAETFSNERAGLKSIAQQMSATADLEKQRKLFSQFTEEAEDLFTDALSQGTIYKQYCPMAFNNKGAYWFSAVPEIRNPYFGDKMLTCGKVAKEINK